MAFVRQQRILIGFADGVWLAKWRQHALVAWKRGRNKLDDWFCSVVLQLVRLHLMALGL